MEQSVYLRLIEPGDTASVLEVYKPYVLNTTVSFEYDAPGIEEFEQRITNVTAKYPWLVAAINRKIIGYAYASDFRYRAAYQWSAESGIYLSEGFQGIGIGSALYQTLFDILRLQGYFNVFAGAAMPNEQSARLHTSSGFEEIGYFKNIGYKSGAWHTTKWWQLTLQPHIPEPSKPKTIGEIVETDEFRNILEQANQKLNQRIALT